MVEWSMVHTYNAWSQLKWINLCRHNNVERCTWKVFSFKKHRGIQFDSIVLKNFGKCVCVCVNMHISDFIYKYIRNINFGGMEGNIE